MKRKLKNILFPNYVIGFVVFNLGFGLLLYVFSRHLEETPLAYVSYLLSFYALVIFSTWFYKVCKFSNNILKKSKLYNFYKEKHIILTKVSICSSISFNLIYAVFNLVIGIYYISWWFISFAIYYLLLCFMKFSIINNINNREQAAKKLKNIGIILLLLNFVFVGIIILIIKKNQIINYNGTLIYLVALYDFYLIITAIVNVIKNRNSHNLLLTASKCINLTVAMISMVSLEVAMVYQFGNNDSSFKLIMTASMGFAICLINSIMAIYMVIKANNNLKR